MTGKLEDPVQLGGESPRAKPMWKKKKKVDAVSLPKTIPNPDKLALIADHGCAALQGARATMEDFFVVEPTLNDAVALFAIFDGHDGPQAAKYASDHTVRAVQDVEASALASKPVEIFTDIICSIDERFCRIATRKNLYSGTTAIVAAIRRSENGERELILCNLGDSRAVLASRGAAKVATTIHCPNSERARIESAGGWITEEFDEFGKVVFRVNGGLSMCRSIGDIEYKCLKNAYAKSVDCDWSMPAGRKKSRVFTTDLVLSTPDVIIHDINPSDDFVILASDGLWDAVSESRAVKIVSKMLKENATAQTAASRLAETAIKRGSSDNTTVIVVYL